MGRRYGASGARGVRLSFIGVVCVLAMLALAAVACAQPIFVASDAPGSPDATTTSLSANPATVAIGQSVTLTATVVDATDSATTPTGTVEFTNGNADIPNCAARPVDQQTGQATCDTTFATAGAQSLTAIYAPDAPALFAQSSSDSQSVLVQDTTTTAVTASPANPTVGQPVTYTATVTPDHSDSAQPTGTVGFLDNGQPIACTDGSQTLTAGTATCTLTYQDVGSHSITASYPGDTNFEASDSSADPQTVAVNDTTKTAVSASPANPTVGQPVTYTATVTPDHSDSAQPTGTVGFLDNGQPITCTDGSQTLTAGTATCTLTYSDVGSHSITASYPGDTNFASSDSSANPQTVAVNDTTTTALIASPSKPTVGQPVTYTATVTPGHGESTQPTGTVGFLDNGQPITCTDGSQTLTAGTATCTVTYSDVGSHSITASYPGDTNFAGSDSSATPLPVSVLDTTKTGLTASSSNPTVGQAVTYTAAVTPDHSDSAQPTGTVGFLDHGQPITCTGGSQTLTAGTATCTISYGAKGSHAVTASYPGDTNFAASDSSANPQIVSIAGLGSSTSLSAPSSTTTNRLVTLTATVAGNATGGQPTGAVHFKNGTADITGCASKGISNGVAVCKASFAASSPPHQLTAMYLGSTVYNNSTSKARAVSVAKDTTTALLTTTAKAVHTGKSLTYSVTVKPADSGPTRPTGKVTFTDHGIAIKSCPGQLRPSGTAAIASCTVTYAAPGSHTVKGSYGGDPNFTGSAPKSALTVTVTWAPVAATTLTASNITATSAVVTGIVQPNGGNVYWQFWYGTGGSFTSASVLKGPRSGHTPVKVSATLTNLKPATTYSYRLVVIPPGAKSPVQGAVMKFTTKAA